MSFLYSGSLWSSLYCGFSSLCVGLYRWLVKVSWLGKLVSVFWWVELYFFSLFSRAPFEDMGCFSGCLMSSAGIQKLFCGIYSTFKCSFDEFVGEKVFSPSYSSAIFPWYSSSKTTEVGCHALLQRIFPTPELNCLLHCRWILYLLSYQGSPGLSIFICK